MNPISSIVAYIEVLLTECSVVFSRGQTTDDETAGAKGCKDPSI